MSGGYHFLWNGGSQICWGVINFWKEKEGGHKIFDPTRWGLSRQSARRAHFAFTTMMVYLADRFGRVTFKSWLYKKWKNSLFHVFNMECGAKLSCAGNRPGVGGTHIFDRTGMCHSNGSLFYKKSLNMGPAFYQKILKHGSTFLTEPKIFGFSHGEKLQNFWKMGLFFKKKP